MGMPEILIEFKAAAETAITRSGRGIAALILKDATSGAASYTYARESSIVKSHWTAVNYDILQKVFLGAPAGVLVERIGAEDNYDAALERLKNKKWDYLAIPDIKNQDCKTVADWIIAQRGAKKTFKAVLPSYAGNHEGIINFATEGIKVDAKTYTTAQYTARIAGILAGMPLDASSTYSVLPEVTAITEAADPDGEIDAGKLILVNDGAHIKIARGVNSLTTLTGNKTEDMKKIKIVDGMDLMRNDIRDSFEGNYIGIANSYDNKQLFINALNVYLRGLAADGVLSDTFENRAYIDLAAQRVWLEEQDPAWAEKDDNAVKTANTKSYVFAACNIKLQDAIEDLRFTIMI